MRFDGMLNHYRKYISIFTGIVIFLLSCKKQDKSPEGTTEPDNCVQGRAFNDGDSIEGEYIISYKSVLNNTDGLNKSILIDVSKDILSQNDISPSSLKANFSGQPGGFIARLSKTQVTKLRNDERIGHIEPDRIIALNTCFTVVEPRSITWNINRIGYGDGRGKKVWIIDSGIDIDHPDLNVNTTLSKSFIPGELSPNDENGHGTHVAGIIGAKNNTFGVLGVASGASLISLRVLDKDGEGKLSYVIQALGYINANALPGDVVNMSLGDDEGTSDILDEQVQNIATKGIYFAIAAGNDHDLANKYSPARANGSNIFTVSAIDSLDNFAGFSNYGNDVVDYALPGVRIISTYKDNQYAYMTGTSMAAPHMAGLLALRGRNINILGYAKNDPDGTPDPIAHY